MDKVSYHTHTSISDGKFSPEELIKCAIENNFKVLAITDHYPRPSGIDVEGWSLGFYTDKDHKELMNLREQYLGKIEVLVGVEFEWLPGHIDWLMKEVDRRDYDVKIISIHQVFFEGKYYTINYSDEVFLEALDVLNGDIEKMVKIYYSSVRDAVGSGKFDILGHFDVIKTLNKDSRYFSEEDDWYKKEVIKTLESVKASGIKMEVNFQGLTKPCEEQWPSKWIINEAKNMGIELVVGTDAHNESQLCLDWNKVEEIMS
ncbi:histidinol-phosphatase [archaeon]|jgi:histidinol-phosphatase (PHP family)|nr:histidinol-phosphatase [archaeon]